jgi:hypothetical protein
MNESRSVVDYRNGVGTVWRDVGRGRRAVKDPLSPSCCLLFALVLQRLPALAAPQKHHLFLHLGKVSGRVTWTSESTLCLQPVESRPSNSRSDQSESDCRRKKLCTDLGVFHRVQNTLRLLLRVGFSYQSGGESRRSRSGFSNLYSSMETGLSTHCEPSTRPTPGLTMLLKVARSLRQIQHSRIRIELSRV